MATQAETETVEAAPKPVPYYMAEPKKPAPPGLYGVVAEPAEGQQSGPRWLTAEPTDYESASKLADFMNRANQAWFYYAKPIMVKKPSSLGVPGYCGFFAKPDIAE